MQQQSERRRLAWCRQNIPGFAYHESVARRVAAEQDRNRRDMERKTARAPQNRETKQ